MTPLDKLRFAAIASLTVIGPPGGRVIGPSVPWTASPEAVRSVPSVSVRKRPARV